ncbi:hypothetical protein Tco_1479975, partial [Tanacetum coccineum]
MHEAVKKAIQLQSDRLRDKAQDKNEDFINKLDDNIKKIIKDQVKEQVKVQVSKILLKIEKTLNEQLEAEVLTRSSKESKTSHTIAANLFELKLKNILIDKIENVEMMRIKKKNPPLDQTGGPREEEFEKNLNQQVHQRIRLSSHRASLKKGPNLITRLLANQPVDETTQHHDWFQKSTKPPTPDRDWNKTSPAAHGPIQPWISNLARKEDTRNLFNEPMDTPLDISAFVMNPLKVDTLTPELLAGPTFELMKGSCKSLVELEYFLEEVYKETTDQLDWNNPEGQQYPHDLGKPLPLIPNLQGRRVIPFDHFINNDLAYLRGGTSSRTYATLVMKTKATDYRHVKWIEDLVPNTMWNLSLRHRIIAVTKLQIVEWHNYKHLDWITIHRNNEKMYTFKEGYPNPRGFIYQNKDKKNKLMRIDELHKFSDGTLNDVRTALDDILKRIRK